MGLHSINLCFKSSYISWSTFAKQNEKQTGTQRGHTFLLKLNAFLTNLAVTSIYRQTSGKIPK